MGPVTEDDAKRLIQSEDFVAARQLYLKLANESPDTFDLWYGLALVEHRLGEVNSAAGHYRTALKIDPGHAAALNNLGTILMAQGGDKEALQCFSRSIEIRPDYAAAHSNMARMALRLGGFRLAQKHASKAIEYGEPLSLAGISLARSYVGLHLYQEAVRVYTSLLQSLPDHARVHMELALAAERLHLYEMADRHLAMAYDLGKTDVGLLQQVAFYLASRGERVRSLELYREVLWADTPSPYAAFGLVNLQGGDVNEQDKEKISELWNDEKSALDLRINCGFALGRIADAAGELDSAALFWQQANALRSSVIEYDIETDIRYWRQLWDAYLRTPRLSDSVLSTASVVPIFIVGMPRSGTTLTERILCESPLVTAAGELEYLTGILEQMRDHRLCTNAQLIERFTEEDLLELREQYLSRISVLAEQGYVTDKLPHNFRHLGLIRAALPEARIIHCSRQEVDTCLSIYQLPFGDGKSHGYAYDQKLLAQHYSGYRKLMQAWSDALGGDMLTVDYAQTATDPALQRRRLFDFCGLPQVDGNADSGPQPVIRTASIEQARQSVYTSSINRSARYTAHLVELVNVLSKPDVESDEDAFEEFRGLHELILGRMGRRDADPVKSLLAKAVAALPDLAAAHLWTGLALRRVGMLPQALYCLRRSARLAPHSYSVQLACGRSLLEAGCSRDALVYLSAACQLRPKEADSQHQLGVCLHRLDRFEEALDYYQCAVELVPGESRFQNDMGVLLTHLGDSVAAQICFRKAFSSRPDNGQIAYNAVSAPGFNPHGSDIEALKRAIANCAESSEHRPGLLFGLASALDQVGDHEQAWLWYSRANEYVAGHLKYELATDLERMRAVVDSYACIKNEGAQLPVDMPQMIFIVGMPRSGSTLVEQIIAHYPNVQILGETGVVARRLRQFEAGDDQLTPWPRSLCNVGVDELRILGRSLLCDLDLSADQASIFVEKSLPNVFYAGYLSKLFPSAKFICSRRQPIANCWSVFQRYFWEGGHQYGYSLDSLGGYYRVQEQMAGHWRAALDERWMDIDLEALINDPSAEGERMATFAGVAFDPLSLNAQERRNPVRTSSANQVRAGLGAVSQDNWRPYERFLEPLLQALSNDFTI